MKSVNENMDIDPKIFRAYDIRALSSELGPHAVERIARAVVAKTGADTVVIGRDMRETSPELAAAAIRGVIASGADAIDIGLCSTPLFYYAVGTQFAAAPAAGAGIMITASHNPKEYNGMKLERGDMRSIGMGEGMEEVRELALSGDLPDKAEGNVMEADVREEYVAELLSLVPKREIGKFDVVCDAGNGMAGHVAPAVLSAYGLKKSKKLYFELDGSFPNHVPNPVDPKNLAALCEAVKKGKADVGVAFDGDADRVGFVDEKGAPVRGDIMTAILAAEVLASHPGSAVLYDLRSSRAVGEAIAEAGGKPVMCRVGHSYIKGKMRELDACFAGELSTHYYFSDTFFAESSDLAMLYVLRAMKRTGKKLSELAAPLMRYAHSGEINFPVKDKDGLMKKIEERYAPKGKIDRLDGLRFDFPDWWFNIRASNTEPVVRLCLEAADEKMMEEKVAEVSGIIANT